MLRAGALSTTLKFKVRSNLLEYDYREQYCDLARNVDPAYGSPDLCKATGVFHVTFPMRRVINTREAHKKHIIKFDPPGCWWRA